MSFPIVMLLNQHHDSTPYTLANDLLPDLAIEGYDIFCQEHGDNVSEKEYLEDQAEHMKEVVWLMEYVRSSINFNGKNPYNCTIEELKKTMPPYFDNPLEWAQTIKGIPARETQFKGLQIAKQSGYSIACIDDPQSLLENQAANQTKEQLNKTRRPRDKVLSNHLFRLHTNGRGAIVRLGVGHHKGVVQNLKEKGLNDNDMVCLFAHSSDDADDAIGILHRLGYIPKEKTFFATTQEEIALLGKKILTEVQSKIRYSNNCHTEFLSNFFKVNFKALIRAEYHVDAILPLDQANDNIKRDLDDLGIKHHTNKRYFVIPSVNTTEVANTLRLLPHKV